MWEYNYNYYPYNNDYLAHYGVKGMKWGVRRRSAYENMKTKKAAYKQSYKDFNKSYNDAYSYSYRHPVTQWFGKNKRTADSKWSDATKKGVASDKAKAEYKQAKKDYKVATKAERKQAVKNVTNKVNDALFKPSGKVVESRETNRLKADLKTLNKQMKELNKLDQNNALVKADKFITKASINSTKTSLIKSQYKDEYRAGTSFVQQLMDGFIYEEGGANHYANQRYTAEQAANQVNKNIKRK